MKRNPWIAVIPLCLLLAFPSALSGCASEAPQTPAPDDHALTAFLRDAPRPTDAPDGSAATDPPASSPSSELGTASSPEPASAPSSQAASGPAPSPSPSGGQPSSGPAPTAIEDVPAVPASPKPAVRHTSPPATVPPAPTASAPPAATPTAAPTAAPEATAAAGILSETGKADYMFQLVNEARAQAGLSAYAWDATLVPPAMKQCRDMAEHDFFSHTSPTWGDFSQRFAASGVSAMAAGENLAYVTGYEGTTSYAHELLMNSEGHRANILSSEYTRIGIAAVYDSKDDRCYFVEWFAK